MLTDECNKQQDATDQPDNQTNLSWRDTSNATETLQYTPQFMQHMLTAATELNITGFPHVLAEEFPTYDNHKHDGGNTGSDDDWQNFPIWWEYGNFSDLQKIILIL